MGFTTGSASGTAIFTYSSRGVNLIGVPAENFSWSIFWWRVFRWATRSRSLRYERSQILLSIVGKGQTKTTAFCSIFVYFWLQIGQSSWIVSTHPTQRQCLQGIIRPYWSIGVWQLLHTLMSGFSTFFPIKLTGHWRLRGIVNYKMNIQHKGKKIYGKPSPGGSTIISLVNTTQFRHWRQVARSYMSASGDLREACQEKQTAL